MLSSLKEMFGFRIHAIDGDIGSLFDLFFADDTWHLRYFVADTGHWLPGRRVLLAPVAVGLPDWEASRLPVKLSKDKVRHSPDIDTALPVSRQQESDLYAYYMWTPYWSGGFGLGGSYPGLYPLPTLSGAELAPVETEVDEPGQRVDTHLRSARDILGYNIEASDGDIGDVDDFIVDTDTWTVRYVVVDTGRWLPGKRVLVATDWIRQILWADETVHVDLTRETIRSSPEFDPRQPISREYEAQLHDYYGRTGYWH